jgi:hypothetical protein
VSESSKVIRIQIPHEEVVRMEVVLFKH